MMNARTRSRLFYLSVICASVTLMRCASGKQSSPPAEPVTSANAAQSDEGKPVGDPALPPELRDVHSYDPAATIDPTAIQSSDFYQIKKDAELNRPILEKDWKAQDDLEDAVKKAKEAEKLKKELQEKKDAEVKEEARLKAVRDYKAQAASRAKYMREANERVKKLPTISKEDIMWNGLED